MLLAKKIQETKRRVDQGLENFTSKRKRHLSFLESSLRVSATEIGDKTSNAVKNPNTANTILALRTFLNSGTWVTHSTIRFLCSLQSSKLSDQQEITCEKKKSLIHKVANGIPLDQNQSLSELFSVVLDECERSLHTKPHQRQLEVPKIPHTVVLVSGMFNEIFSTAAFERGAQYLRDQHNIDYLILNVKGGKSSEHNARLIQQQLQRYIDQNPDKKLWILAFSKGGVDSLHYLAQNKEFANKYISGLSTIASPILGTERIEHNMFKAVNKIRAISNKTVGSVLKDTSNLFFHEVQNSLNYGNQKNWFHLSKDSLPEKPFYSAVALKSKWYESHIWMMLTKLLFQSKSANDGVVDTKYAQFPEAFDAINLGIISGHHLIGTRSSFYSQEALLEAHLILLRYIKLI